MTFEIYNPPSESEIIDIHTSFSDVGWIDEEPVRYEFGASTYDFGRMFRQFHKRETQPHKRLDQKSSLQKEVKPSDAEQLHKWIPLVLQEQESLTSLQLEDLTSRAKQYFIVVLNRYGSTKYGRVKAYGIKCGDRTPSSPSDTAHIDLYDVIRQEVARIFIGTEDMLADETEEVLANRLSECIKKYQGLAVTEIQHLIVNEEMKPESVEAVLRILGDIDDPSTYKYRRQLLEKAVIDSSSSVVRDAASVGLSYMDDPHAIPSLKKAIEKETCPLVRKSMKKTFTQLEDTEKCLSFCGAQSTTSG